MRLRGFAFVTLGLISIAASLVALGGTSAPAPALPGAAAAGGRIVGPGLVEPVSEEITLGVEIPGRIVALMADEGDAVKAGQPLARLENRDYAAQVALAEARLAEARADRLMVRNGSRDEERDEARALVQQARATLTQAEREADRRDRLALEGVVSREERDRARRDADVARARLAELSERRALVEAGPRVEEHAKAEAAVALARAALQEAMARLAKTLIVSPIDGVVLRRDVRIGETVSPEVPGTSLFVVGDVSRLRVRVDVDERDVGRLKIGRRAWVTAKAFEGDRFEGRVVEIGRVLGRKTFRLDEPRERVDTKVLETLIELQAPARLPIGLRVDATISIGE